MLRKSLSGRIEFKKGEKRIIEEANKLEML